MFIWPQGGNWCWLEIAQTLEGPFSAVSNPNFVTTLIKGLFCIIFQGGQLIKIDTLLHYSKSKTLQTSFFHGVCSISQNFGEFFCFPMCQISFEFNEKLKIYFARCFNNVGITGTHLLSTVSLSLCGVVGIPENCRMFADISVLFPDKCKKNRQIF